MTSDLLAFWRRRLPFLCAFGAVLHLLCWTASFGFASALLSPGARATELFEPGAMVLLEIVATHWFDLADAIRAMLQGVLLLLLLSPLLKIALFWAAMNEEDRLDGCVKKKDLALTGLHLLATRTLCLVACGGLLGLTIAIQRRVGLSESLILLIIIGVCSAHAVEAQIAFAWLEKQQAHTFRVPWGRGLRAFARRPFALPFVVALGFVTRSMLGVASLWLASTLLSSGHARAALSVELAGTFLALSVHLLVLRAEVLLPRPHLAKVREV